MTTILEIVTDMAKTKERSELEFLRSENKRLKSENRQLKKLLGRNTKTLKVLEEHFEEEAEEIDAAIVDVAAPSCPKCCGELAFTDLGNRRLTNCTSCKYRRTSTK